MKQIKVFIEKYWEIITYLFWGVMATIVSWGSYSIFAVFLSNLKQNVAIANVLSWVCAVIFAFFTNKIWVFNSRSWKRDIVVVEVAKFLSARILTGILELVGVPLLVSMGLNQTIFGIDGMLSKVLVSIAVVILNYVFSKLFIFSKKK